MSLPNSYGSLGEETTDNEIKNDKQLRNNKKKLQNKETKLKLNFTEVLQKEIHKLKVLINEYETKNEPVKIKKEESKKTNKSKESDDFLEKEYQKNKDRNEKRYEEQKRKEKFEKEKRKQEQEAKRERNSWRYRSNERTEKISDTDQMIYDHGLNKKDLPQDILEIISDYSHKLWKQLSLKYHPDKFGEDTYSKLLNCLKDNFNQS
jgi:bisphosphoglycerate-dependent phosphoglycerate mutase